jgi:hypothetical protein
LIGSKDCIADIRRERDENRIVVLEERIGGVLEDLVSNLLSDDTLMIGHAYSRLWVGVRIASITRGR